MDLNLIIIIYIVLLVLALASGIWVAFAMILVGVAGIFLWMPPGSERIIGYIPWVVTNSFLLTAIPLFIFMGELLFKSGISERLYNNLNPFLSHFPGQLLHTNIASCAIFAAACGSSPATAATIGTVAMPHLQSRGYDATLSLGSIAAGGTLGILIPPSVIMIIYGGEVGESIARLFLAGIVPGVILTFLFMLYIGIKCRLRPELAPEEEKAPWGQSLASLIRVWPIALLFLVVLGGIYLGIFTATEAAGIGSFGALVLALGYKKLTKKTFYEAVLNTVRTSCMVTILVVGSRIMVVALANLQVPQYLVAKVGGLPVSPLLIFSVICLFYIILGMIMDGVSMIVLTLPITYPIITSLGYDSVWFGIIVVILVEMALITPPVGINLYILQGIQPDLSLKHVIAGSIPFFTIILLFLIFVTAFPQVVLWLPNQMMALR